MTTNSQSLEARLYAAQANLAQLQQVHGEASLALARGAGCSDAELNALEEEIAAAEKVCRRLEAAIAAQAEANTDAAIAARQQERQEARRQVEELGPKLESLALQMVERIEGLTPLLAEFETLSQQRRSAAADAIRYQAKHTGKAERDLAAVVGHAALREGPVPAAVLAALWRTGLTRVLSVEYLGANLPAPDFYGSFGQGEVREALQTQLGVIQSQLTAHMDRIQRDHER